MTEVLPSRRLDPEWGPCGIPDGEDSAIAGTLEELPIFDTLSAAEIGVVEGILHRRLFSAGEVVVPAWVQRSGMFVIEQGLCHVLRRRDNGQGQEVIGELERGDLVGEFSLLDDSPRSTTVVAAEPSHLLGFFQPDLLELNRTEPRIGFKIMHQLSRIMGGRLRADAEALRRTRKALEAASSTASVDPVHPSVT